MPQIDNIKRFLHAPEHGGAYSDERLAALLAHTEGPSGDGSDGKLSFDSCCCLIGVVTAEHPLEGHTVLHPYGVAHFQEALLLPYGPEAEQEFKHLAPDDEGRRKALLPLIREEMQIREFNRALKAHSVTGEFAKVG